MISGTSLCKAIRSQVNILQDYTSQVLMRQIAYHAACRWDVFDPIIQPLITTGECYESFIRNIFRGTLYAGVAEMVICAHMWNVKIGVINSECKLLKIFHKDLCDIVVVHNAQDGMRSQFSSTRKGDDTNWKIGSITPKVYNVNNVESEKQKGEKYFAEKTALELQNRHEELRNKIEDLIEKVNEVIGEANEIQKELGELGVRTQSVKLMKTVVSVDAVSQTKEEITTPPPTLQRTPAKTPTPTPAHPTKTPKKKKDQQSSPPAQPEVDTSYEKEKQIPSTSQEKSKKKKDEPSTSSEVKKHDDWSTQSEVDPTSDEEKKKKRRDRQSISPDASDEGDGGSGKARRKKKGIKHVLSSDEVDESEKPMKKSRRVPVISSEKEDNSSEDFAQTKSKKKKVSKKDEKKKDEKKKKEVALDVPKQMKIGNTTFYYCHFCDSKFTKKYACTQHMKYSCKLNVHKEEMNFNCEYCDFKSARKQNLIEHINFQHLKKYTYVCKFKKCEAFFYHSAVKSTHEKECPHKRDGFKSKEEIGRMLDDQADRA